MILTVLQLSGKQREHVRKAHVLAHEPAEVSPGQEEKGVGLLTY